MEAVQQHFREVHKDNIIKPVESHKLTGTAARSLRSPELVRFVRSVWEDQRRFPLQIATVLSQQFAGHGLQFFKVNKTITHVAVARPHYLDLDATPVSEGVKKIVDYINAHAKCTRRTLLEALAPAPAAPAIIPVPAPAPVAEAQPAPDAAAPAETSAAVEATPATATPATAAPAQAPTPAPSPQPQPTAEQTAVISDLHWLIHQGHVIEFANGTLETAKKPLPKPPKPEPKPAEVAPAPAPTPEPAAEAAAAVAPVELPAPAAVEPGPEVSPVPENPVPPAAENLDTPPPSPAPVEAPVPAPEPLTDRPAQ
jgi:hypothetical protein